MPRHNELYAFSNGQWTDHMSEWILWALGSHAWSSVTIRIATLITLDQYWQYLTQSSGYIHRYGHRPDALLKR